MLREAAAAGAEFVLCPEHVGDVAGYDFRGGPDGTGYYRRPDAPPPDGREYSRMVLQRASAAGAEFVAWPERVMDLPACPATSSGWLGRRAWATTRRRRRRRMRPTTTTLWRR